MKRLGFYFILSVLLACNAQSGTGSAKTDSTGTEKKQPDGAVLNDGPGCGNSLLFRKGVIMEAASYDGTGKQTNTSIATVTDVTSEGGMTIAHVTSKLKQAGQAEEKAVTSSYKCDGQNLTIDLSNFSGNGNSSGNIEESGVSFPVNVKEGETLPDASYSMTMQSRGKTIKVTSHVTQRKVEAKEQLTIQGGTFTCYKISSIVEAVTDMQGISEKSKQMMEKLKANMPKNKMILWYAPDATVLKMEYYMGDKLVTKNEVTAIKK